MFITEEDYRMVIGDTSLQVLIRMDPDNREMAEMEAVEEISGYLRQRYDCESIFAADGNGRNRQIVMYACDIALYHMSASAPGRMGADVRKERYERAVEWLRQVQSGVVTPDLPAKKDDGSGQSGIPVLYGSTKRHQNTW